MHYKKYKAKVDFDDDDDIFRGRVIGVRDYIIFEGKTTEELRRSFHTAVDDYLAYCANHGEKPDKPYSGKFLQRVSSDLQRRITTQAEREGKSFNAWVAHALQEAIDAAENACDRRIAATTKRASVNRAMSGQ
jgi:predicted HicB family RNase H-like nuclease